jgi:hypothetical protein
MSDELGPVGIGAEMDRPDMRAQWNMYWLSDPAVDQFLVDDEQWLTAPTIDIPLMMACCASVRQKLGGEPLARLLLSLNPQRLVLRIKSQPHEHLAPFKLVGAPWLATIESRAGLFRGAVSQSGSVVEVSFARRPSDLKIETAPERSATIMTLASRKT